MEYVYAALLVHKLGKKVDEKEITKVLEAAGAKVDESKVKSLVASLKDVDIDSELANAIVASAAPVSSGGKEKAEPEEKPKEEKREAAAEGLSALFG
jgi:large subunit ribosomal protein L12